MTQEMTRFWSGSGISWTIRKQYASCSRQITTTTPHHSIFTGQMLFLTPNQQCQSTEGTKTQLYMYIIAALPYQVSKCQKTIFGYASHNSSLPSVLWRCWLGGRKGIRPVKKEWWGAGMVICLERGADLHMAQLMPMPLTVSCFSKIQIGFTFWYRLTWVVPDKGPLNGCV